LGTVIRLRAARQRDRGWINGGQELYLFAEAFRPFVGSSHLLIEWSPGMFHRARRCSLANLSRDYVWVELCLHSPYV